MALKEFSQDHEYDITSMNILPYLTKEILKFVKVRLLSHVLLFATTWTVAYQGPLSMGFSRQQYWSGLPFPSPGDLPDPRIEPRAPELQTDALRTDYSLID